MELSLSLLLLLPSLVDQRIRKVRDIWDSVAIRGCRLYVSSLVSSNSGLQSVCEIAQIAKNKH